MTNSPHMPQAEWSGFAEGGADKHGWRLIIDGATTKGQEVLLFFPKTTSGRIGLQPWIKVDRLPISSPRKPTHWQPLPHPPEE